MRLTCEHENLDRGDLKMECHDCGNVWVRQKCRHPVRWLVGIRGRTVRACKFCHQELEVIND
jgi:hypothetical protein